MMESTRRVKSMGPVHIPGKMAPITQVSGTRTGSTARASTLGMMVASTTVTGKIIIWMDTVCTPGKTAENMKANTLTIKRTDMECIPTLTDDATKECGRMESSMGRASLSARKECRGKANGKPVNGYSGTTRITSHL